MEESIDSRRVKKRGDKLFVLSNRCEEILRTVYFYRYMTAMDVCHLLYSPSSLTYVRKLLTFLAGGGDDVNNQYLYRFPLPSVSTGNSQRIYTLGGLGRDYLVREAGLDVDWYFRPGKVKHMSYSSIMHNVILTRVLVAGGRWARLKEGIELSQVRTCYELGRLTEKEGKEVVEERRKGKQGSVIPDGWLLFEGKGKGKSILPVLLEIDRGTAYRTDFKSHVRARIEYIKKGGVYSRVFGTEAVTVAYVAIGENEEARNTRVRSMRGWTMEVLKELGKEDWTSVFRFCGVGFDEIYERRMFEERLWYRPDQERPVGLFTQ